MPEIKVKEAAVEAVRFDPKEEIVALYCCARKNADGTTKETRGAKVEVCKAGEASFFLRANQYARIKRGAAEWHIFKHKGSLDHPLDLQIKTLEEIDAIRRGQPLPPASSERDAIIKQLLEAGAIQSADEAEGVELDDLKEML